MSSLLTDAPPTGAKYSKVNVAAALTAPRYGCTRTLFGIFDEFRKARIPLQLSGGAFYGQCMQRMLSDLVEIGTDIAITVDFDSVFTASDVQQLISALESNPHIDAIAALQSRRGMKFPLLTHGQDTRLEVDGPVETTTAHFGLTAIDLRRLRDIPKPWFWSSPDISGDWDGAKIDDDIYFWKQWREHGRTIYVHPFVSIGHQEEIISQFVERDGRLEHEFIYPQAWYAENLKP